ncbi:MAG: sensor domain-containing diguanylate cyclase, partial [Bacillota bacterium]|nr:sensor domain-containing diguanylate cyclase [Bacillota bacterium]
MRNPEKVKKIVLLIWFLLVPAGLVLTYIAYPPHFHVSALEIFSYLFLACVVAAMPLVINNTPIFLLQWVSMAVLLRFGLFMEIVFVQVAVVVVLTKIRVPKEEFYRFPLNFSMFFIVSFLSGSIYYLLGGKTGEHILHGPLAIFLAVLYAVMNYAFNQIILSVIIYFKYNGKQSFFGMDFVWETVTTFITFPIGFVLYMLYAEVGILALFFVGLPFASLSIILSLYHSSQKVNIYLQKATEIGHQLAERVRIKEVMDLFIQKLMEMLPVDYAYILDVVDQKELKIIRHIEKGEVKPNTIPSLRKNEGISGIVWANRKAILYKMRKDWKNITSGYIPEDAESVLSVPIVRNNQVVGVLVLASRKKRAYEKSQLMIVDILCSHFAVAIENARHYEMTKENSERCSLTKLYNYRFFETMLTEEFTKLHLFERKLLSLIILDIDHFKAVNDTYGHQSGNEILIELANRLQEIAGDRGTVARYGGEEFVILLPDMEKETAYELAEHIRQAIANRPFTLKEHLEEEKQMLLVRITASIGVATAPQDADDSLS